MSKPVQPIIDTGANLQELILAKGWTIQAAARFLGVSRQRLYQVFKQDAPAGLWVCAVRGLPEASPQLLALATTSRPKKPGQRLHASNPVHNRIAKAGGYTRGDVLIASSYIGEIADEGDEGVIRDIKRVGNFWTFLVRFQRGEDWFPDSYLNDYMAPTGQSEPS